MRPEYQVNYIGGAAQLLTKVFFTGTGALEKGIGVCYDFDYGVAADSEARRYTYVELPSVSNGNNNHFAGVTTEAYPANPAGQMISISLPGGVAWIASSVNTTAGETILTCSASAVDAGRFGLRGFMGRGSARANQTKTCQLTGETDGTGSVNATAFTGVGFVTGGVAAGDKVVIYAGADGITLGTYTVASVTNATTLVLTASASAGALVCSYYIIRANPLVMAYLLDGPESGLCEWVSPVDNDVADCMESGWTRVFGPLTLGTAVSTATIGNGAWVGIKKTILCYGTLTTSGWDVAVAGTQVDGSTALAGIVFDAAAETAELEWKGLKWQVTHVSGATQANS